MSIDIYLFGELKEKFDDRKRNPGIPTKYSLDKSEKIKTVYDLLKILKTDLNEISHIFVNGKYCGPGKTLNVNDRIGLFPKNMALNFVEIEQNNPIQVKVRLNKGLKKFDRRKLIRLNLPEGSNIKFLLHKLNLEPDLERFKIKKNGNPINNLKNIVHNEDSIIIGS